MSKTKAHDTVVILDFGSQYTQLIARRVREAGVYCEILPYHASVEVIAAHNPRGVILSGGPSSVYDENAPRLPKKFLEELSCPVLGICYGLQVLAADLGGQVQPSSRREYGYAKLKIVDPASPLFTDLPEEMDVWMSHGDQVTEIPPGFHITALSDNALNAFENLSKRIYGVQFHPEVAHTPLGAQVLRNFLNSVCQVQADWSPQAIISEQVQKIKDEIEKLWEV